MAKSILLRAIEKYMRTNPIGNVPINVKVVDKNQVVINDKVFNFNSLEDVD
jgi:hypothetical protein